MRKNLWILAPVLVSVLGLTSCSPDTSSDEWRLRQPHIIDPGEPSRSIAIASALLERPSARAELVFEEGDLAEGTLEVSSSCRANETRSDDHQVLRSVHRIPLGSLWPVEMWKKLRPSELETTICSFAFTARNAKGSTHSFKIAGLRLKDFGALEAATAKREKGESWSLLCDGFTTETGDDENEDTLSIRHMAIRASSESRPLGRKNCRLFSKKEDAKTGLRTLGLSQSFELAFPNPQAVVETQFKPSLLGTIGLRSEPILQVRLKNPAEVPVAYRIKPLTTMRIQPLMRHGNSSNFGTAKQFDQTMTTSVTGAADHWDQDGYRVVVIAPRSIATITASIAVSKSCLFGLRDRVPLPPRSDTGDLVGFFYGFDVPFNIESIDFWTQQSPRFIGETHLASTLNLPITIQRPLLAGFQGSALYSSYDSTGAPPASGLIKNEESVQDGWCD